MSHHEQPGEQSDAGSLVGGPSLALASRGSSTRRAQRQQEAANVAANKLALVYPYRPRVQAAPSREQESDSLNASGMSADRRDRRTPSSAVSAASTPKSLDLPNLVPHGCDDLDAFCAKTGWFDSQYVQQQAKEEFTRYCHRALDGAVVMLVFALSGLAYLGGSLPYTPWFPFVVLVLIICLLAETALHCIKRGGDAFTYRVACIRHAIHVCAALASLLAGGWHIRSQDLPCLPDASYEQLHGHTAPPKVQYLSCIRGINASTIAIVCLCMCTLTLGPRVHVAVTSLFVLFELLAAFVLTHPEAPLLWRDTVEENIVRLVVAIAVAQVSNLGALAKHRSMQRGFEGAVRAYHQMQEANQRLITIDSLLCSMVPPQALRRLVAGERVLDHSPQATVLFGDMINFTHWSAHHTPGEVVQMLNVLVRGFDTLAVDMSVSKIKTIGDCYWAVTGLPTPMERHAEVMVTFGLEMLTLIRRKATKYKTEWSHANNEEQQPIEFRVGIHSGPLQGGILGSQQLSYEVFGETSNMANWVEQHGIPMKVLVTRSTKRLLAGRMFQFQPHAVTLEECTETGRTTPEVDEDLDDAPDQGSKELPSVQLFVVSEDVESPLGHGSSSDDEDPPEISSVDSRADDEFDQDWDQRQRFIEAQLAARTGLGGGQEEDEGEDGAHAVTATSFHLMLKPESLDKLEEEYGVRKYCCCSFEFQDSAIEEQFHAFVLKEIISLRLGGSVTLLGLVVLCLVFLFLADARSEISAACQISLALGILLLCWSAIVAHKRLTMLMIPQAQEPTAILTGTWHDTLGPLLGHLGIIACVVGAFLAPDSIMTNRFNYFLGLVILLLTLPNLHLSSLKLLVGSTFLAFLPITMKGFAQENGTSEILLQLLIAVSWTWLLTVVHENRLRVQFLNQKVTRHFATQQQVAVQAQEVVLRSIVPDFVIAPLVEWLSSNFDPSKTVANQYEQISIAFLKLDSPMITTPRHNKPKRSAGPTESETALALLVVSDDGPEEIQEVHDDDRAEENDNKEIHEENEEVHNQEVQHRMVEQDVEWMFKGHQIVEDVLSSASSSSSSVVEKVKTMGDTVMIAGSFRGHPSHQAAAALLTIVVEIQKRSCKPSGDCGTVSVGLHAGPVMGIVLGYSRLTFDIFGDAVNTTSRVMTSPVAKHGIAASTNFLGLISDNAKSVIESSIPEVEYGPVCVVDTKGKGTLEMRQVRPYS